MKTFISTLVLLFSLRTAPLFAQTRVVHEGITATAGSGGVTAKLLASKDTSNPTKYILPSAGGCGSGVAQTTATSGNSFYLLNAKGSKFTGVAEGAITAGHMLIGGTSTPGRVADSGVTSLQSIPVSTCVVGIATANASNGADIVFIYLGQGTFGQQVIHGFGATFGDGSTTLTAGPTVISDAMVIPQACTIISWDITVDAGTATFNVWKTATGSAVPTSSNNINTSGVAISSGTAVHSTTLSDFTTTAIAANDIAIVNLAAVSGAKFARLSVQCQ